MAFSRITNADTVNKGVIGLPDTPGLSTYEMQAKFDELALDVLVPKHNLLATELEATSAAASIGAVATTHTSGTNVKAVLDALDTYSTTLNTNMKTYVDDKDTAMKDYVDGEVTTINSSINALTNRVNAQDVSIAGAVSTANSAYNTANTAKNTADNAYNRATDALNTANDALTVANGARAYVDVAITNLTNLINQKTTIIDPITGQPEDIQTVINDIFDYMRPAPITAQQYDELGLTAEDYEAYGLTAYQYDMFAAQELL